MTASLLEFGSDVVVLSADVLPLLVALALAPVVRTPGQGALFVVNLWLLMELVATAFQPGYQFASLIGPRLLAVALQVALACAAVHLWRHWRLGSQSVTVH